MVVPIDPFERGELDLVDRLPRSSAVDQLGLVESDRRLREGVVIAVAHGSDRGVGAGVDKAPSEAKGGDWPPGFEGSTSPFAAGLPLGSRGPRALSRGSSPRLGLHRVAALQPTDRRRNA